MTLKKNGVARVQASFVLYDPPSSVFNGFWGSHRGGLMSQAKKGSKTAHAQKASRPLLIWPVKLRRKLAKGWNVIKRELKIPDAEEIKALRDRAEWLEKRITSLGR
jgi:hypothetical protein